MVAGIQGIVFWFAGIAFLQTPEILFPHFSEYAESIAMPIVCQTNKVHLHR